MLVGPHRGLRWQLDAPQIDEPARRSLGHRAGPTTARQGRALGRQRKRGEISRPVPVGASSTARWSSASTWRRTPRGGARASFARDLGCPRRLRCRREARGRPICHRRPPRRPNKPPQPCRQSRPKSCRQNRAGKSSRAQRRVAVVTRWPPGMHRCRVDNRRQVAEQQSGPK